MERNNNKARYTDETEQASYRQTDKILFAVKEGNLVQAREAALAYIESGIPGYLKDPLTEWKFMLVRMMTLLVEVITRSTSVTQYLEKRSEDFLRSIEAAQTEEECREMFVMFVEQVCNMNAEMGKQYSQLVQKIMEQVAMDLTQPLTLQYFSDRLNVNSSYLSNLFRQQTGVTITEYVTDKRITHAATLLAFTRNPIKTVAKQVGISDVQYFSRLFKRRMEMTPSQYRLQAFEQRSREMAEKAR